MRFIQRSSWLVVSAAVLAVVLVCSHVGRSADPITATSGVPELASLKKFHSIPNFAIGG